MILLPWYWPWVIAMCVIFPAVLWIANDIDRRSRKVTQLTGPLAEWAAKTIPVEAAFVHSTYKLVPTEDIEQEMWTGLLERRDAYEELIEKQQYGIAMRRLREVAWRIIREDDRYRRAVKAARAGYRPVDEQFYTIRTLKALLPYYLDNGVTERPPQGREQPKVSGGGSGSDYMAMMLDVAYAMSEIRPYHQSILERYYAYPQGRSGWKHHEIASALGIPEEQLRHRRDRALRAMQRVLGGRNPWNRRALEYQETRPSGASYAA